MASSPWSWPLWWRIIILLNISFYNLLGNVFAASMSPLFGLIIREFHSTETETTQLATYVLLTLGLSNFLALPSASLIGKRYTILLSLVIFLAASIWSGEAQSYTSLRAARIVGGLAAGLIEALGPTIVAETFQEQHLARAMVVYVGLLAAGASLGPIVAGAVAQGLGDWRWFQRIMSVAIAVNLVACILMLPETTHAGMGLSGPTVLEEETTDVDIQEASIEKSASAAAASPSAPLTADLPLRKEFMERSFSMRYVELNWKAAAIAFIQPLELLILPQVIATTLVFGLTIGWFAIASILISIIYVQPPFLWDPLPVGLLNVGPLVGLTIGLPVGGTLADWLYNRHARRHHGATNPATRLPALLPGALVSPAGCLLVGFALRDPANYTVVCVGWGMLCLGLTGSANVLLTYAVDSLPTRAGHIGTLVNVTKNTVGFVVSYGAVDWLLAAGPVNQFGTMAGVLWAAYLMVIPIYVWSKPLVERTARLA